LPPPGAGPAMLAPEAGGDMQQPPELPPVPPADLLPPMAGPGVWADQVADQYVVDPDELAADDVIQLPPPPEVYPDDDRVSNYGDAYGEPQFMDVDAADSDVSNEQDAPQAIEGEDDAYELPPPPDEDAMLSYLNFVEAHDREQVLLNPKVFKQAIKQLKFKPSVDLFASATHHQLHRYYSKDFDPVSLGQDAFKFDWLAEAAPYANPPWTLIPRVLRKVIQDRVRLMLVVPEWPNAPWYIIYRRLVERSMRLTDAIYLTDDGVLRPPPRWATRIAIVDGNRW